MYSFDDNDVFAMTAVDLDRDGVLDPIFVGWEVVGALPSACGERREVRFPMPRDAGKAVVASADVNGDGVRDIVVTDSHSPAWIYLGR